MKDAVLVSLALAGLVAIVPVAADAAAQTTFRDIDYSAIASDVVPREVRLAHRLAPEGAPGDQVIRALKQAGAHETRPQADGSLRFVYASTVTVDDMQHDTTLTITMAQRDGHVSDIHVVHAG
jgi:hypothetical protein